MDTQDLIERMRRAGAELTDVEVKSAARGLPGSVVDTISAFANGSGGTIILGIDERAGFMPSRGFDASAIRDALADACVTKIEPPCRAPIDIEPFEGALVVRLDVPEIDPVDKPCFVSSRGAYGGSFIRGGDGDRLLTHYEITQFLSNRTQPQVDREPVPGSTVAGDLDPRLLDSFLSRVTKRSPGLDRLSREDQLLRLGVITHHDGELRPTLAGLICFGVYPQQYFPQLFVSFVVVPGLRLGETAPDGRRFLDNVTLTGPIPDMVAGAIAAAIRNMRVGAVIRGAGRRDVYDYPLGVVRELVVNAVMHRDYSPEGRGAQVQIELYPDRLQVRSIGGLYGPITVADLGSLERPSTSRNRTLAALMADIEYPGSLGESLCENRGSGLPAVMNELRRAGMSPPEFDVRPGWISVTVPQAALLSVDVVSWIGSLGLPDLTDAHHLALAMMRTSGRVTNAMLQAWGIDRLTAGEVLRDLVNRGLALRRGGRRYASYSLLDERNPPPAPALSATPASRPPNAISHEIQAELDAIIQAIRAGHTTRAALEAQLGLPGRTLARRLHHLVDRGLVAFTEPTFSKRQSYQLTGGSTDHGQ